MGETEAAKAAKAAAQKVSSTASQMGDAAQNVTENKHELGEKKGYFKVLKKTLARITFPVGAQLILPHRAGHPRGTHS